MTEPKMTPADARRVLTEWRDEVEQVIYAANIVLPQLDEKVAALTYALSQVWIPQDVAQAALPLVEKRATAVIVAHPESPTVLVPQEKDPSRKAIWQALADALGGK